MALLFLDPLGACGSPDGTDSEQRFATPVSAERQQAVVVPPPTLDTLVRRSDEVFVTRMQVPARAAWATSSKMPRACCS